MYGFEYSNPVKVIFGSDALDKLKDIVHDRKVLFVYGGRSLRVSGNYEKIMNALREGNNTIVDYGGHALPLYQDALKGIGLVKQEKIDCIIGAGGCSVMDMAKIIAFGAVNNGLWSYLQMEKDPSGNQHLLTVEIPTYPSGGSEVDAAAETDDTVTGKHGSLYGSYADYAVINPELSYSLNKELTGYSGMVSFVQLAANYIGNESEISKAMLKSVMLKTLKATEKAQEKPDDYEARATIMWASSLSTQGILGCGNTSNLGGSVYGAEGAGETYGPLPYRAATAMYFPRFLVLLSRWHPSEIKEFCTDVLGVDERLDPQEAALAGEKKLIDWGEKHEVKMYFDDFNIRYDPQRLYEATYAGDEYSHDDLFQSFRRCFRKNS